MNKSKRNSRIYKTPHAKTAIELHKNVPADWYEDSIRNNLGQRFWHWRRFKNVSRFIKEIDGDILDIGCCDGYFTKVLLDNSKAKSITAIDVLEHAIDHATEMYSNIPELTFEYGEAHKLKYADNSFDHVFCLEALEHVENPAQVLSEMKRVLKPGGKIHILIPAENLLFKIIWAVWSRSRGKIWSGSHLHEYEDGQVCDYIEDAGFEIETNHLFLMNMLQFVIAK